MKTIGLLGGMSWESTVEYYQLINREINNQLGGLHSAKIALISVDFNEIEHLQQTGNWAQTAKILSNAARNIEKAGADFLVIATNTMHIVAKEIEAQLSIPLLHIADATAEALIAAKIKKVALLGTAFTMEKAFYKDRLREQFGLEVLIPNPQERALIHKIIYQELCLGIVTQASKTCYLNIIQRLFDAGAEAVILGCTEIGLLVKQADTHVPIFDTTELHALKACAWALKNENKS